MKASPKDFFMHILAIVMLVTMAISSLVLAFQLINIHYAAEVWDSFYWNPEEPFRLIRGALAFLIVATPVYVYAMMGLEKSADTKATLNVIIRKWLVYLTLFATGLTLIGALISLLVGYLNGDLTAPFGLKVLGVMYVAGLIFGFYRLYLRDDKDMLQMVLAGVGLVSITFGVILGFVVNGTPQTIRERNVDEERVERLQDIHSAIQYDYAIDNEALPESLDEIPLGSYLRTIPVDPETGDAFEYTRIDEETYKLCATFSQPSYLYDKRPSNEDMATSTSDLYERGLENWNHDSGRVCFEQTINLEDIKKQNVRLVD